MRVLYSWGALILFLLVGLIMLRRPPLRREDGGPSTTQSIEGLLDACRGALSEERVREIEADLECGEYEVAFNALVVTVDEETTFEFDESCKLIARVLEMQFYGALEYLYERTPDTIRSDKAANTGMKP